MGIAMGDPIDRVNLLYSISETGFTGLIEPQKWVRSILIRSKRGRRLLAAGV